MGIRSLIHAPAKIVAPLMYSTILFSGMLDWIVWKHIPDLLSWIGIMTVCLAGSLAIIFAGQEKSAS